MKFFLFLFLSVFSLYSCNSSNSESAENELESESTTFFKHKVDGMFTIEVPGYFKETNDLNADAALQFVNLPKGIFILVIAETLDDSIFVELKNNTELLEIVADSTNLSYYIQYQVETLKEKFADFEKILIRDTIINNLQSKIIRVNATDKVTRERLVIWGTAFNLDNRYFYIYQMTPLTKIMKYEKDMEKTVGSFNILASDEK